MSQLARIRNRIAGTAKALRHAYLTRVWGMEIGKGARISFTAKLDKTFPQGIHIGENSAISFHAAILTHDFINGKHRDTFVGSNCFIGARSIILPGVRIGDSCIIAAGSVVMRDVPPNSIVAGNPAAVIQSGITTGRWGIRNPAFLKKEGLWEEEERVEAPSNRPLEGEYVRLICSEVPELTPDRMNEPLNNFSFDSFSLLTLRITLEQASGGSISDRKWTSAQTPADLVTAAMSASGGTKGSAPGNAGEVRSFTLDMPQMALSGLSESWLFKEIGDTHWSVLTKGLRTPSSQISDDAGNRLYATFTRIRMSGSAPMRAFKENEELELSATSNRFGAGIFFSEATLRAGGKDVRFQTMSSFSRKGEAGANTSLLKGQPTIPDGCEITPLAEMPEFGKEYRLRRAAELAAPLFETEYSIIPPHDINGVGLLYFAAYPMINDICASVYRPDLFDRYSTIERDVFYFANSDPKERILFRIHKWEEQPDRLTMEATLSRTSDNVVMAYLRTTKALI